jgi:hypothetical protein
MASSPIAIALRAVSPKYILTIGPLFGWLLRHPIQQEPSKFEAPSPSLFLFLFRSFRRPKRRVDGLPYAFHPFKSSLQCPPPSPTLLFGWLLRLPVKWRPSKAGAPPVSHFFEGRHFGATNKGTKRSAREPGRREPLLGSWRAAAPRFKSMEDVSMEREGKAGGGRVSIGSSCVVCCCVCVVSGYMYPPMYPFYVRPKHFG